MEQQVCGRLISNLETISKLPAHSKLSIDREGNFYICNSRLSRWWNSQNRDLTASLLTLIVAEVEKTPLQTFPTGLISGVIGALTIMCDTTYHNDTEFVYSRLKPLILRLERYISPIETNIYTFVPLSVQSKTSTNILSALTDPVKTKFQK
jgi:hypothetical protein